MRRAVPGRNGGAGERRSFRSARAALLVGAVALGVWGLRAPAAQAEISVGFAPDSITVAPGDTFTVALAVLQDGAEFNAFDAAILFDPTRLTFVPTTPVGEQQGPMIRAACRNTFHRFGTGPDSLEIALSLLCSNAVVTRRGDIYQVKFQAGTTPGSTTIRLGPSTEFYRAGLFARPVRKQDLSIVIAGRSLDAVR
jgi:hypothetical protein